MSDLHVSVSEFTGSYAGLNGEWCIPVFYPEYIWAAITVGAKSVSQAFGSSLHSVSFAFHKALAMLSALDLSGVQPRVPSDYHQLDQSEKACLAYWVGMASTKIVAQDVLCVPWLRHARHLKESLVVNPTDTKSLPDLLGTDRRGDWHVIEAKGRHFAPYAKEKRNWKAQAQRVVLVSEQKPKTQSYCVTMAYAGHAVSLVDPEFDETTPESGRVRLQIERPVFMREYYRPFQEFLESGDSTQRTTGNAQFRYRQVGYDPIANTIYEFGAIGARL